MNLEITHYYMIYNSLIATIGILGICFAAAKTKQPICLWALLLLSFFIMRPPLS